MLDRDHKVPLRHLPSFFSFAKKIKKTGFSFYYQPSEEQTLRFTCVISSGKKPFTSVERTAAKRTVYAQVEKIYEKKLVYNLDIVCVLYAFPTDVILQSIQHEISILAVSSAQIHPS